MRVTQYLERWVRPICDLVVPSGQQKRKSALTLAGHSISRSLAAHGKTCAPSRHGSTPSSPCRSYLPPGIRDTSPRSAASSIVSPNTDRNTCLKIGATLETGGFDEEESRHPAQGVPLLLHAVAWASVLARVRTTTLPLLPPPATPTSLTNSYETDHSAPSYFRSHEAH